MFLDKLKEYKDILHTFQKMHGNYTIMLVPHDGKNISRKELDTDKLHRALKYIGSAALGSLATILVLCGLLYNTTTEVRELTVYRQAKDQQEQKLQMLTNHTEELQKKMATIAKIEEQVREQMKKLGMEPPEKEQIAPADAAKGGPNTYKLAYADILQQQNATLDKNMQVTTKNLENLLASLKSENYRQEVTPSKWPVDGGYISSEFGSRANPFDGSSADYHPGIDIAENYGAPVYASASGHVQRADWYGGYGKYIRLSHDYGYATAYGHLSKIAVKAGDYVEKGQVIGYVGSTGYSTGPHLHFEVLLYGEQINPGKLIKY